MGRQTNIFEIISQETNNAIEAAAAGQEQKEPMWNDSALSHLRNYIRTHNEEFLAEDFREYAEAQGLSVPKEPRAYGAVMINAKKQGLLISTGNYRPTKDKISHRRPMMTWIKANER